MRRVALSVGAVGLIVIGFAAGLSAQMVGIGPFALGRTIAVAAEVPVATCETLGTATAQVSPFLYQDKLWLLTRCENGRLLVNPIAPLDLQVK